MLPDGEKLSIVKRCIWLAEYIDRKDTGDPHGLLWQIMDDVRDIGNFLSKLDEKGCHGAPDWVIEIVSPSSKPRDYIKKMLKYGTANVREYWIVDPEEKIVTVYGFENETMKQYPFGKAVPVGIYEGFSINVS